jgi:hypothetical protein
MDATTARIVALRYRSLMKTRTELTIQGIVRVDPAPVSVVCPNGIRWVIDYDSNPEFDAFGNREVMVSGVPGEIRPQRTSNRLMSRDGRLDHFRVSRIADVIPDADIVEIAAVRQLAGRFREISAGVADLALTFETGDGAKYEVVNPPAGAPTGDLSGVRLSTYPVRRVSSLPTSPAQLWIGRVYEAYVGEWRDNKRHGQGTCIWRNGETYVGEWRDDQRHGHGTCTWSDGKTYVGEWQGDKRHGEGTCTWGDGRTYVGEWRDGRQHGLGTETRSDGEKYVGEWRGGLMAGLGVLTKPNGEKYVGERRDSMRHGNGILSRPDGTRQEGVWENGTFVRAERVVLPAQLLAKLEAPSFER